MELIILALGFTFTLAIGRIFERIKVPWVFGALLFGLLLSFFDGHKLEQIDFLGEIGMYFLLFIIGFEMDWKEMKRELYFIGKGAMTIILLEATVMGCIFHLLFHYSLPVAFLLALSFATVGEAILVPILDEFKMINTLLGRMIIGIGTIDNIIEVLTLILAGILISGTTSFLPLLSLLLLFLLTYLFKLIPKRTWRFPYTKVEILVFLSIAIVLLFAGIGKLGNVEGIAALLAGIAVKNFLPEMRVKEIKKEIKAVCYGFFAPIFFISIGMHTNASLIFTHLPLLVFLTLVAKLSKIVGGLIVGRKRLGIKRSFILGLGLSIRFSTSLVVMKMLLDHGILHPLLYSLLVGSSIIFKFIVPPLFSYLLSKWRGEEVKE